MGSGGMCGRIRGYLCALLMVVSAWCMVLLTMFPSLVLLLVPCSCSRRLYRAIVRFVGSQWCVFAGTLLRFLLGTEVFIHIPRDIGGIQKLREALVGRDVILVSNHPSRVDWMYLWMLAMCLGRLDNLKIAPKAELKFAPIFGWAMQCMGYIFISRKKTDRDVDKDNLKSAVSYHCMAPGPGFTLAFFPEGTNFAPTTKAGSDKFAEKMGFPQYTEVLHPRTTGFQVLLETCEEYSAYVPFLLDATVAYHSSERVSEKALFFNGAPPYSCHIRLEVVEAEVVNEGFETTNRNSVKPLVRRSQSPGSRKSEQLVRKSVESGQKCIEGQQGTELVERKTEEGHGSPAEGEGKFPVPPTSSEDAPTSTGESKSESRESRRDSESRREMSSELLGDVSPSTQAESTAVSGRNVRLKQRRPMSKASEDGEPDPEFQQQSKSSLIESRDRERMDRGLEYTTLCRDLFQKKEERLKLFSSSLKTGLPPNDRAFAEDCDKLAFEAIPGVRGGMMCSLVMNVLFIVVYIGLYFAHRQSWMIILAYSVFSCVLFIAISCCGGVNALEMWHARTFPSEPRNPS